VAAREVSRINRARASHYQHYTDRRWEDVNNYDLVFDTSTTSTDLIVDLVASVYSKA
jgi:cytidylate kinase